MAEYPIGLFPAVDYPDLEWSFRVEHCAHLLGDSVGDTMRMMVRFIIRSYSAVVLSTWLVRHRLPIASWTGKSLKQKSFR